MLIKYNNHLLIKLDHKIHIDICFTIDYNTEVIFFENNKTSLVRYYDFLGELCTIIFHKFRRKEKFYVVNNSVLRNQINLHKYQSKFIKFKCKLRKLCL